MKRLTTNQARDRLNAVHREDNTFYIVTKEDDPEAYIHTITFQNGPRKDEEAQQGLQDMDLLDIILDRLEAVQNGPNATKENACAITHIKSAMMWMNKHTEAKIRRQALDSMGD